MPDRFDAFWSLAVRKEGKGYARKCYARACKRADEATIMEAWAAANRSWCGKDLQFVPHPATWLNQDRWEDGEPCNGATVDLEIVATHVRRPWYERGHYSRDVLEQCVAADLLTRDEMEEAL